MCRTRKGEINVICVFFFWTIYHTQNVLPPLINYKLLAINLECNGLLMIFFSLRKL